MKKITLIFFSVLTVASYGQELISDSSFESSSGVLTISSTPWKGSGSNIFVFNNSSNANSGVKYVNVGVNNGSNNFLYQ